MKLYDVTLTCDHKVVVAAESPEQAVKLARGAAIRHGALPSPLPGEEPEEIPLDDPRVLVWYPGPFSEDAIVDLEDN